MSEYGNSLEVAKGGRRIIAAVVSAGVLIVGAVKYGDSLTHLPHNDAVPVLTGADLGDTVDGIYAGTNNDVSRSIGARMLDENQVS